MQPDIEESLLVIETTATQIANNKMGYTELLEQLERLCERYLALDQPNRAAIRECIGSIKGGIHLPTLIYVVPNALYGCVSGAAERIKSREDVKWLRMGLAAASIEDARMDSRDLLLGLSDLYLSAEEAGIDPKPYFQEIASISAEAGQALLSTFHESACLQEVRRKSRRNRSWR